MKLISLSVLTALNLGAQAPCAPGSFAGVWNGWGANTSNTRYQPATSITAANVGKLEVKWAFGMPGARSAFGPPSVMNGRVFLGAETGQVYALNADTGCMIWAYKADTGVRTAITLEKVSETRTAAFFGDVRGKAYAVDANTGEEIWKTVVETHPAAKITGAPVFFENRLYVPVSSNEEGTGGGANYACCTFRGSLVALAAESGREIWKTYTIADAPKEQGKKPNGVAKMGPSGGSIFSAPTIDSKRQQIYITTSNAYSAPAAATTDSVAALDLKTGVVKWSEQETKNDIWIATCMGANKPDNCGPDHGFGSPAILVTVDGRDILVAGQKSGNVWAHDPDTGKLLWRIPLVADTTQFGGKIVWGGTTDSQKAYFGLGSGGIAAVQLRDGEKQWFTNPPLGEGLKQGHEGALASAPGVVFSGGFDGVLRALNAADGKVIWEYDTAKPFETVNAVQAKGGSLGAPGPIVAGDMLFVASGYVGVKAGLGGNVLLAFGFSK